MPTDISSPQNLRPQRVALQVVMPLSDQLNCSINVNVGRLLIRNASSELNGCPDVSLVRRLLLCFFVLFLLGDSPGWAVPCLGWASVLGIPKRWNAPRDLDIR